MKKTYFILGDWADLKKSIKKTADPWPVTDKDFSLLEKEEFQYLQIKFPNGGTCVLEHNKKTGQKLLLRPLEETLSKGFFKVDPDFLLDYLLILQEQKGYWPTKELDLPEEIETIQSKM